MLNLLYNRGENTLTGGTMTIKPSRSMIALLVTAEILEKIKSS